MGTDRVQILLEKVKTWAQTQPKLTAIVLVGSHARGEAWEESDIDLVLITPSPGRYLNENHWVRDFGDVSSFSIEDWGKVQSLRVHYANGLEVEFGITDLSWVTDPLDDGTLEVIAEGFVVLFDRQNALAGLPSISSS